MTHTRTFYKRTATLVACASLASLLAACGGTMGGYYDEAGNYVPTDTPYNMEKKSRSPMPGGNPDYRADREDDAIEHGYHFNQAGYYDYNGYYIARNSGLTVPRHMFPGRGLCRVWFPDRAINAQPPIETCNGLRTRIPVGAYIIYGG